MYQVQYVYRATLKLVLVPKKFIAGVSACTTGTVHVCASMAQVVIVTLGQPVYDAASATLEYTVSFVPGQHNSSIVDFYRRAAKVPGFVKVSGDTEPTRSVLLHAAVHLSWQARGWGWERTVLTDSKQHP